MVERREAQGAVDEGGEGGAGRCDSQPDREASCGLSGQNGSWEAGPRSAAELKEAATHYERVAALHSAPAVKTMFSDQAAWCRGQADVM